MEEKVIDLQTSKLAAKAGFDEECDTFYYRGKLQEDLQIRVYMRHPEFFFAPTQELLHKWLREKKYFYIEISYDWITYDVKINHPDMEHIKLTSMLGDNAKYTFTDYEEAFEAGLQKALKLIKKESDA